MRYIKLIEHISSKTYLIQNDKNNEPLTSVTMRLTQQFSCVEWHTERQ
jgi:hypothetical protein